MSDGQPEGRVTTADIGSVAMAAPQVAGVLWELQGGAQMDARLVQLQPGQVAAPLPPPRRDTIFFVVAGEGVLEVEDEIHHLEPFVLAYVPGFRERTVRAGRQPLALLVLKCREDLMRVVNGHRG